MDPLLCEDQSAEYAKMVCDEQPEQVANYKAGKLGILGFLVGCAMVKCLGSCNPSLVVEAIKKEMDQR